VIAFGVIIFDEGPDLLFKIAWRIVIFKLNTVFHGLMLAFDFTLSLGMERRTANMVRFLFFQLIGQIARDVT
jgi:hypothetical protein